MRLTPTQKEILERLGPYGIGWYLSRLTGPAVGERWFLHSKAGEPRRIANVTAEALLAKKLIKFSHKLNRDRSVFSITELGRRLV
jgi:hypothetical protein